jgi:serine/threonine-protein kinase
MGTVYKAEDLLMGRVVAIKVVSPHLTTHDSAAERFRREIRAAAQLNDPRAIIAHDTGEAGGCHFLVMEFVEGISLDRLVAKKGPLPVPMACSFARQAALGLQHAAERGMIHRDIKPQNLMATRKGQVKILDFGLARFASGDESKTDAGGRPAFGAGRQQAGGVTNPNFVMGTPDYLSPEQARDSHEVDHRSDLYSLGCTLYFLLTAQPPFLGATTLVDKLFAHTEQEPPPVRDVRPDAPDGLAEVLAKMMAKRREDRYQTAAEVAAALQPFTRANAAGTGPAAEPAFEIVEAVAVTPAPRVEPATDTAPPPESATLTEAPRAKRAKKKKKRAPWWKRHGWSLAGAAALLLVAGIAVAVVASRKPADKHASASPPADPGTGTKEPPRPAVPPAAEKGEKGVGWVPPTVIAPPKDEVVVLVVIPSQGVWPPDYDTVREALTAPRPGKPRVRVETAAASGDRAAPAAGSPGPPAGIPIDVRLTESTRLSKYSAVVFLGFNVEEYVGGSARRAAGRAIEAMQAAGKPVASMSTGQAVLAAHGVLKGRKAALPPREFEAAKFREPLSDPAIKWQKRPVVVDDAGGKPVVTAAGALQAEEFAQAILRAIEGK